MHLLGFNIVSSGSKGGNSTILWDDSDLLVFDMGISLSRLQGGRMSLLGLRGLQVSAFISHEHSDHSSGIRRSTGGPGQTFTRGQGQQRP